MCIAWCVRRSLQAADWAVPCQEWSASFGEHWGWKAGLPSRMFRASHHCLPGSLLSQLFLLNINDPMSPESHYH